MKKVNPLPVYAGLGTQQGFTTDIFSGVAQCERVFETIFWSHGHIDMGLPVLACISTWTQYSHIPPLPREMSGSVLRNMTL